VPWRRRHQVSEATLEFLARLSAVEWFAHAGQPYKPETSFQVGSWAEAVSRASKGYWENRRLDASNDLSSAVHRIDRNRFHGHWNRIVAAVKKLTQPLVEAKAARVIEREHLSKEFVDCVHWDILSACLELEYSDIVPPEFFARLAKVYLAGHFPCGEFKEGGVPKLMVY